MTFPYGMLDARVLGQDQMEQDPSLLAQQAASLFGQPQAGAQPIPEHGMRQTPPPSIRDRIMGGLFPAPSAMQGLVAPEDVKNAQRQGLMSLGASMMSGEGGGGLLGGLGRGIGAGQNAFTAALQNAAQLAGYSEKLQGERDAKAQQKLLLQKRQDIIAKYPPVLNETVQQTAMRLQKMLPEFIAANDTEMVGKIVELLKSQGDLLGNKATQYQEVDAGDRVELYDPRTGQLVKTVPKGMAPRNRDAQDALQAQRDRTFENTLVTGYQKQIADRLDAADFVNQTLAGVPAAKAGDGAAQVELLYAFVKALDPQSVVREGEVALAREATPLVEWAKANVDKVRNKAVVVPSAMVDRFATLLTRRLGGYEKYIDRQRSYYIKRAERGNLSNADALFLGARELLGDSNVAAPPNAGPSAAGGLPDVRSLGGIKRGPGPGGY